MKKVDEDELEEIEEELVEEHNEKEEKRPMPVHSAELRLLHQNKDKKRRENAGNEER